MSTRPYSRFNPKVNVFLHKDGTIRLADFGIAVIEHVGSSYTRSQPGGAAGWKAPELLDAEDDALVRPSAATDIYAFGCVCVEVSNR